MSKNIKLDIQLFGAGGGNWSEGITKTAIDEALESFRKELDQTEETLRRFNQVDAALKAGWSGTDCDMFIEKYHAHAEDVCEQIETYYTAVAAEKEKLVDAWTTFQAGNIQ